MKAFRGLDSQAIIRDGLPNTYVPCLTACSFFHKFCVSTSTPQNKYGPMLRLLRNARANAQQHAFLVPTGVPVENRQSMLVFAVHTGQPYQQEL